MAKINRRYVSEAGELLKQLDEDLGFPAESQQQEIDKHRRIRRLRDDANAKDESNSSIWEDF